MATTYRHVSVIVPVKNGMRTLPRCLAALAALDPAPTEIVLVDNKSTDQSGLEMIRFMRTQAPGRVRVLTAGTPGAAAARNVGAREAWGTILVFTDADCLPATDWLRHLLAPFEDAAVGAVAGRISAPPPTSLLETFCGLYTLRSGSAPSRHQTWTPRSGGFPTANFAVRRFLFSRLDGFDPTLAVAGEDYDFCARLYRYRYTIAYTPKATVQHLHRSTLAGMLRQAFGFGTAHPLLLRRYAAGAWLDLPGRSLQFPGCPVPLWIDLAGADKKCAAVLTAAACLASAPLVGAGLCAALGAWLYRSAATAARRAQHPVSVRTTGGLALLLLLKSAALTAGRLRGSLRHGTLCV